MNVGQVIVVTEGLDSGRKLKVTRIEDDFVYAESLDGNPLESGHGILTEFGFLMSRIRPVDGDYVFTGQHIVIREFTKSGKKNVNPKARPNMKGIVIKANEKRSQVKLETGEVVMVGNNLLKNDDSYVPPKPISIKKGNLVVIKIEDRKEIASVESVTGKRFSGRVVSHANDYAKGFTADRFDVIRKLSIKDVMKYIEVKKPINDIENELKIIRETKREVFKKFDLDTAFELTEALDIRKQALLEEQEKQKVMYRFKGGQYSNWETKKEFFRGFAHKFVDYKSFINYHNNKENVINYYGHSVKKSGNVFLTEGTFKLMSTLDKHDIVTSRKKPTSKSDYIGIEIECMVNVERYELDRLLIENGLHFNCKLVSDCSIYMDDTSSKRGLNPIEITFIAKRSNYKTKLKKLIDLIHSIDGYVNDTCGLHIHFDMRHKDPREMYKKLINIQPVMFKLVNKSRRNQRYCERSDDNYDVQYAKCKKYSAINLETLERHNTIEVRLHHGSIDYEEITNWIDLLLVTMDNNHLRRKVYTVERLCRTLKLDKKMRNHLIRKERKLA